MGWMRGAGLWTPLSPSSCSLSRGLCTTPLPAPRPPPRALPPHGRSRQPCLGPRAELLCQDPSVITTPVSVEHSQACARLVSASCSPEGSAGDLLCPVPAGKASWPCLCHCAGPRLPGPEGSSPERAQGAWQGPPRAARRAIPTPAPGQAREMEQRADLGPGGIRGAQPRRASQAGSDLTQKTPLRLSQELH